MTKVTYVLPSGERVEIDNANENLMSTAVANGLPGIEGACGGVGSCGTCHVQVEPEWVDRVGAATQLECDMLDLDGLTNATSRLGCQVEITPELDGLVVRIPKA
jgi:ferredoxin, 2Fe-2S